jgi:predicted amidohydrolase
LITAAALQFRVTMDPAANAAAIASLVEPLAPDTLVVAPEGALSGYENRAGFTADIDIAAISHAISATADLARAKRLHIVAGACLHEAGRWSNSALYFGPYGERARYDKINLAISERDAFEPGDTLPVFDISIAGQPVRLGIQMCREIRYPEQWRALAMQGAQVIAYVNNAIGSTSGDAVWRAHMISRAAETQRFIVGANNAAPDQTCPSMIVAPDGAVLAEATGAEAKCRAAQLDLSAVSDWVLSQARSDVVAFDLRGE